MHRMLHLSQGEAQPPQQPRPRSSARRDAAPKEELVRQEDGPGQLWSDVPSCWSGGTAGAGDDGAGNGADAPAWLAGEATLLAEEADGLLSREGR